MGSSKDASHVYGCRAWNRLDGIMFETLKRFLLKDGSFNPQIDWPGMTAHFNETFEPTYLANMFTLDLLTEIHMPGLSIGMDGRPADHIKLSEEQLMVMNGAESESFRALCQLADKSKVSF